MVKIALYAVLTVVGLMAGAFAPRLAASAKPPPNSNDAIMRDVIFRRTGDGLPQWATEQEITCAATTAYNEARGEGVSGYAAVVHVMLNRKKDPLFPKTLCDIMRQKAKSGCNFSWVCDGKAHPINEPEVYLRIKETVKNVIAGKIKDPTHGAKYFCTIDHCLKQERSEFFNRLAGKPNMKIITVKNQAYYTTQKEREESFLEHMNARTTGKGANR